MFFRVLQKCISMIAFLNLFQFMKSYPVLNLIYMDAKKFLTKTMSSHVKILIF